MPRRPPPRPPVDLPPGLDEFLAGATVEELRAATAQVLDLAGERARRRLAPVPTRRRRARSRNAYAVTVRVDLVDARPAVWRRLVLPSTLQLDQLHGVLQAVFGWTDSHLHRFSLGDSAFDDEEHFLCPYDVEEGDDDGVPASDVRLDEVLRDVGDALLYTYDYGDQWDHRMVVEEVGAGGDVRVVDGGGAAPPEDSGGVHDGDAGQALPFDLAEAQEALTAWSAEAGLPPELAQLLQHVARSPQEVQLRALLDAAALGEPVVVDDLTASDALRRYTWLLDRVGDGLTLTQAGWLPPAVVTAAMEALWSDDHWIGKGNREDLTEPVRALRASAVRLGLLRVAKGRLSVTKAGQAGRQEPQLLWSHVVQRLGARRGSTVQRTAQVLALVTAAAGRRDHQLSASLLTAAGWGTRGGGPVDPWAVRHAAADVVEALDVVGVRRRPDDARRLLARAALQRR